MRFSSFFPFRMRVTFSSLLLEFEVTLGRFPPAKRPLPFFFFFHTRNGIFLFFFAPFSGPFSSCAAEIKIFSFSPE